MIYSCTPSCSPCNIFIVRIQHSLILEKVQWHFPQTSVAPLSIFHSYAYEECLNVLRVPTKYSSLRLREARFPVITCTSLSTLLCKWLASSALDGSRVPGRGTAAAAAATTTTTTTTTAQTRPRLEHMWNSSRFHPTPLSFAARFFFFFWWAASVTGAPLFSEPEVTRWIC